jgi:plasmid stabilization system protein ParE
VNEYEVSFLSPAYEDLAAAIKNISQFSNNASEKFLDDLDRQTAYLQTMPKMYPVDEDHPPYRKMVLRDYLVYYSVDDDRRIAEIYRILPARMDQRRFFIDAR